jgi:hypothetical protein
MSATIELIDHWATYRKKAAYSLIKHREGGILRDHHYEMYEKYREYIDGISFGAYIAAEAYNEYPTKLHMTRAWKEQLKKVEA